MIIKYIVWAILYSAITFVGHLVFGIDPSLSEAILVMVAVLVADAISEM